MSDGRTELDRRVREWLEHEGYPLEFQVGKRFNDSGFAVRQGSYVRDTDSDTLREVDVLAHLSTHSDQHLLRVYHVVECKWSKDKPWVVFTRSGGIAPSACVTQSIASLLGSAILWKEAGLKELHSLDLFAIPERTGFNGRQALSKDGSDRFYNSIRSVVSAAKNLVDSYDNPSRKSRVIPRNAVVAFPVIVVEGDLYETFLHSKTGSLELKRAPHIRCHWRGSKEWSLHATIDVVTFDYLEKYLATRSAQVQSLLRRMRLSLSEITRCVEKKSIHSLKISEGSRGVVGLHRLFCEFIPARKKLPPPKSAARDSKPDGR